MQAEFAKDENGFIWFFHAKEVHFRWQPELSGGLADKLMSAAEAKKLAALEKEAKERARQELVKELTDFEAKVKNIKDPSKEAKGHHNVLKMMDYMGTYYDNLKDKSGISGDYLRVDKQDIVRLEDVIK